MVKFGFQSSKYNNLTLEQEIAFSDNNKIDFFDVFFDGFTPEDVKNVQLPQNVTVHLPIGFTSLPEERQNSFFEYINLHKPISVTIHFCELNLQILEKICKSIPETKVCIENTIPDSNSESSGTYLEFMTEAKKHSVLNGYNVYATFDTGHAKINGFECVEYAKKVLDTGAEVLTLHLHDNDGKNDSHWAAGSVYNGINFSGVLEVFKNLSYDVNAVIEHWNNNYNALEYLQNL